MPQPSLERFAQRAIVVADAGTTLNRSLHGLLLRDGSSQKQADPVTRQLDKPYLGASTQQMTNFRATINGTLELRPPEDPGHATYGIPPTDAALRPCGLARALSAGLGETRYNVVSSGFTQADLNWWHATTYLEVRKAAGDLSNLKMEIGAPFSAKLALTGPYTELGEAALPTDIDMTAFDGTPTIAEPENTQMLISTAESSDLVDLAVWGKSLDANLGHAVAVKRYTELRLSGISDRDGSYTAIFAKTDFSDFNPDDYKRNRKVLKITFMLREPDGRYSLLGVLGQVDEYSETDVEGDLCYQIQGKCTPTGSSGNNEIFVEFGYEGYALRGRFDNGVAATPYVPGTGISTINGTGANTFALAPGSALPAGLILAPSTGALSGTPTTAGTYSFAIVATDTSTPTAKTTERTFTMVIAP